MNSDLGKNRIILMVLIITNFTIRLPLQAQMINQTVFVPIVLSSPGMHGSFFTSEMTMTNRGAQTATLVFTYTAAFGQGSGTGSDILAPGQQRIVPDALAYLRSLGLPIPASGMQGGTMAVTFSGLSSPSEGAVIVRTTTAVAGGRAGLAYAGMPTSMGLTGPSYLCGLRQNTADRSNVAVQNAGSPADGDVTLRLTVFSGDPAAPFSKSLPDITLPPGGFGQISGILQSNGLSLTNGYVRVERIGGTAPYYAYAVINDQLNSDGSFIPPVLESTLTGRNKMTLPAMVESGEFTSELVVTNWSSVKKSLSFGYKAHGIGMPGSMVNMILDVHPSEQLILPDFVQRMRDMSGMPMMMPKGHSYAGAMFAEVDGADLSGICISARTSAPGGGGRFGVFYGSMPSGMASTNSAWVYGLQQNAENRSNLAIVNTGETDGSTDDFRIELFDGDTGVKVNTIEDIEVDAKGWTQVDTLLARYAPGTTQGYVHVIRTAGNNPFIAYGVINDGAQPGERTGDGAYLSSAP
jgi:hypothetical protein